MQIQIVLVLNNGTHSDVDAIGTFCVMLQASRLFKCSCHVGDRTHVFLGSAAKHLNPCATAVAIFIVVHTILF